MGFFDGAASKGLCGAGLYIKLGRNTLLNGWLKAKVGSNTKAKLVALWGFLYLSKRWGLTALQVLGDSQVVVKWAFGQA